MATLPYSNQNDTQAWSPGASFPNGLRIGNIPDGTSSKFAGVCEVGVPVTPLVEVYLDAPEAADVDHFATTYDGTVAGAIPLLNTDANGIAWNDVNSADGDSGNGGLPYFCRNVTISANQSTSGTVVFVVIDAQGKRVSRTVAIAAATSATTAWTCMGIVSATVTVAFNASTTFTIGCGNVFGVKYPMYANTILKNFIDAAGDDYPADTDALTVIAGVPGSSTNDWYGTYLHTDVPDGTSDYVMWFIPTYYWSPGAEKNYPITEEYRPS